MPSWHANIGPPKPNPGFPQSKYICPQGICSKTYLTAGKMNEIPMGILCRPALHFKDSTFFLHDNITG